MDRPKAGAHKHLGLGIALDDRIAATFYRQIFSLATSFFPFETSAPGLPGSTCIYCDMLDVLKEPTVASRARDSSGSEWLCLFYRMSDYVKEKLKIGISRSWHPQVQSVPRLQLGDPSSHKRLS